MTGGAEAREAAREADAARARLRRFMLHLSAYFAAVVALMAINLALDPGDPWFLLPLVGWGGILAFHAAHVMGLFRSLAGPTGGGRDA